MRAWIAAFATTKHANAAVLPPIQIPEVALGKLGESLDTLNVALPVEAERRSTAHALLQTTKEEVAALRQKVDAIVCNMQVERTYKETLCRVMSAGERSRYQSQVHQCRKNPKDFSTTNLQNALRSDPKYLSCKHCTTQCTEFQSCDQLKAAYPGTVSGQYWLKPKSKEWVQAWCDMDTDVNGVTVFLSPFSLGSDGRFHQTCAHIKLDHANAPSGIYMIDPSNEGNPFKVYCDMETDGGGWTVFFQSQTGGATGPTTRITTSFGVLRTQSEFEAGLSYSISLQSKTRLAPFSAKTLFVRRDSGAYMIADAGFLNADMGKTNKYNQQAGVNLRIYPKGGSTMTTTTASMSWTNYNNNRGGDFSITSGGPADRHNPAYWMLNRGCGNSYIYEYGAGSYESSMNLGAWKKTHTCAGGIKGLSFYVATRGPVTH